LLVQNPDKINWEINWDLLSGNPNAISLIEKNQDKIYWSSLSQNPGIFESDYQEMSKDRTKIIYQELMQRALHPSRVLQWIYDEVEKDD
jgi:hypothetical protein